ncbi:MAG: hypothetical protein U0263_36620 [Polyangiaceae bacterium]
MPMLLAAPPADVQLNPIKLMLGSSGVVLVVLLILMMAATGVWVIWLLKSMQLSRSCARRSIA